jgi:hypothetical protein
LLFAAAKVLLFAETAKLFIRKVLWMKKHWPIVWLYQFFSLPLHD